MENFWHWIQSVFFAPGEWVLHNLVENLPRLSAALGLTTASYQGLLPMFISALVWLYLLFICSKIGRLFRGEATIKKTDKYINGKHLISSPSWFFLGTIFVLFLFFLLLLAK
ncbi:hypothetical protein [Dongshaea marina]|uniref:hypothetical protein n=1 Tax=Dongshaea marina TaxID=2047966 RepID=UPI00131F3579|nr:hypothetical protein [Dongshaea marina]